MTRSDNERIADLLDASSELAGLAARGRDHFDDEHSTQLAIERLLEIIGEAANGLAESTRDQYPGVPWRDIARLRIVLAHHYHRIDRDLVWTIATRDVPQLESALRQSGS